MEIINIAVSKDGSTTLDLVKTNDDGYFYETYNIYHIAYAYHWFEEIEKEADAYNMAAQAYNSCVPEDEELTLYWGPDDLD